MMDSLDDAREELKRVDHLIYVSLKYTRTVDVLLNAINRMIDAYEFLFDSMLKKAVEDKKIEAVPGTPIEKGNKVIKLYPDDEQVSDNVGLYFLLRKLHRSPNPEKVQEYRRHVTMKTMIDGNEEIVNIDIITNYYHFMLEFFKRVESIINPKE